MTARARQFATVLDAAVADLHHGHPFIIGSQTMTAHHHPTGQPLAIITPALERLIQTRIDQVHRHGHTPAADDATGAGRIIDMAHGHTLRAVAKLAEESAHTLQMAGDMARGSLDHCDAHQLAVLQRRLSIAAACNIAAQDIIDRHLAARGNG